MWEQATWNGSATGATWCLAIRLTLTISENRHASSPQLYIRKSPFFKLDKVQAPVLIFHGTADTNVPPSQSWSYFRALQYYGKVPVKFVVFPGEPHGPRKLTHQIRKIDEEMAWFDKYFFKTSPPENEAVKAGSPLDTALRTKTAARTGEIFGSTFTSKGKPVLIPEVVTRWNLEVGRFEVTRAQFSTFDKNYKVERGTENYPASGITLEQAKAYAHWLSKLTGQAWRVPNESEMSGKYDKKEGENTLDYWAGYAPNPDDSLRIREKLKELPGTAPLLKPVGSFAGQGQEKEELIFDLGGNVAEWVLTGDGKGKVMGGSADCPADTRSTCTPARSTLGSGSSGVQPLRHHPMVRRSSMVRMRPIWHISGAMLIALFVAQGIASGTGPTKDDIDFRKDVYTSKNKQELPYRLFVPLGYDASRKYPLVLWLHGSDGRGNDNVKQLTRENQLGSHFWISGDIKQKLPMFVMAPQCPSGQNWAEPEFNQPTKWLTMAVEALAKVQKQFSIDPDRVLACRAIDGRRRRMVAAAELSREMGGSPGYFRLRYVFGLPAIAEIPLWVFQGDEDPDVHRMVRSMMAQLKKAHANVRYTEYHKIDHEVWKKAFAEPDLFPWLSGQKRVPPREAKLALAVPRLPDRMWR